MTVDNLPPTDKLAAALAKAQAKIEGASKDATNPHFKTKYSDLSACWAACRGPLSENGLSVVQIPSADGDIVSVRTLLLHSSGQSIEGVLTVRNLNTRNPSQGIGSCITYLRRYALCAFVGISPEDDDGEGAADSQPAKPAPRGDPPPPPPNKIPNPPHRGPTEPQLKRLYVLVAKSPLTPEDVQAIAKKEFGVNSSSELSREQYDKICNFLIEETEQAESHGV